MICTDKNENSCEEEQALQWFPDKWVCRNDGYDIYADMVCEIEIK